MTKIQPFGCDVRKASDEEKREFLRLLNEIERDQRPYSGSCFNYFGITYEGVVDAYDYTKDAKLVFTHLIPISEGIAILKQALGEEEKPKENDVREKLAEYAHNAWSGWMKYLFDKSIINNDGTCTIPKWAVERWQRQLNTS